MFNLVKILKLYYFNILMEKNNYIFISNSCLGEMIHNELCKCEYNNPFVATLIPEDYHFLKLCENKV